MVVGQGRNLGRTHFLEAEFESLEGSEVGGVLGRDI